MHELGHWLHLDESRGAPSPIELMLVHWWFQAAVSKVRFNAQLKAQAQQLPFMGGIVCWWALVNVKHLSRVIPARDLATICCKTFGSGCTRLLKPSPTTYFKLSLSHLLCVSLSHTYSPPPPSPLPPIPSPTLLQAASLSTSHTSWGHQASQYSPSILLLLLFCTQMCWPADHFPYALGRLKSIVCGMVSWPIGIIL